MHATDEDVTFAGRVVARHGGRADTVLPLPGVVNVVLRVIGPGHDWVVRSPADRRRANEFPTEVWAAHQASLLGVPTPRVVGTGHVGDRPYLILEHLDPQPEQAVEQQWGWLGRYAAVVATVPLDEAPEEVFSRFGRDLAHAWRAHLTYNLDELSDRDALLTDGVYRRRDLAPLRTRLERLGSAHLELGLAHGDLAPRNLISRGAEAPPVLLDWGAATTGPAPWTDLQRVYAWAVLDGTVDSTALHQFADAAGLPLDDQVTALLEQLSVLRLLDLARWARERRPDLYAPYRDSARRGLEIVLGAPSERPV